MNDLTMSVIQSALHGLAERQRTIADNLANVQTPGYTARRVDFETNLERAAEDGDEGAIGAAATPVLSRSTTPARQDGNNVDLDDETVDAMTTNLRYQTMVEAMTHKFRVVRQAIGQAG